MATVNLQTAVEVNFTTYEGDTEAAVLSFSDTNTATPINLSGAVITMEVRTPRPAATLVDTFSTGSGDIVISGAGSNIVTIKGWGRLAYASAGYIQDLQVVKSSVKTTYFFGKITQTQEVTKV